MLLVKVKERRVEPASKSRHASGQGYYKQRCSNGMARQDKSRSLHMATALPERREGEFKIECGIMG